MDVDRGVVVHGYGVEDASSFVDFEESVDYGVDEDRAEVGFTYCYCCICVGVGVGIGGLWSGG